MEDLFAAGGVRRRAARAARPAASRLPDGDRRDAGRAPRADDAWVDRGVIRPRARSDPGGGRAGRAVRLAGAGWRHPQALGRRRRACSSARAARSSSTRWRICRRGSTIPSSTSTPDDFLVLQERRPDERAGHAGGRLPADPAKLARAGVKDMVRISDARMSGTAFGTIVLHVTPEAAAGGPLALVRNGDRIRLSVKERRLDLLVDAGELARRRGALAAAPTAPARGYRRLYWSTCCRPTHGCDFDFLRPERPRRLATLIGVSPTMAGRGATAGRRAAPRRPSRRRETPSPPR